MTRIPCQVNSSLQDLAAAFPTILGDNLIGIYLYGSLTQDAFNPDRSDVDVIVVIQCELSDSQFERLESWFGSAANPWVERLQVSFLIRDNLFVGAPAGNCLYQF